MTSYGPTYLYSSTCDEDDTFTVGEKVEYSTSVGWVSATVTGTGEKTETFENDNVVTYKVVYLVLDNGSKHWGYPEQIRR